MKYELPDLQLYFEKCGEGTAYKGDMIKDAMRQYAEQAVAPLLAEIDLLEKENKRFERALYRIAVVRAMDYEYRKWANDALLGLDVVKE